MQLPKRLETNNSSPCFDLNENFAQQTDLQSLAHTDPYMPASAQQSERAGENITLRSSGKCLDQDSEHKSEFEPY